MQIYGTCFYDLPSYFDIWISTFCLVIKEFSLYLISAYALPICAGLFGISLRIITNKKQKLKSDLKKMFEEITLKWKYLPYIIAGYVISIPLFVIIITTCRTCQLIKD